MSRDPVRKHHLTEHLDQDYDLLRQYEDRLRYEDDPKKILKIKADIGKVKRQIIERQNEMSAYDSVLPPKLEQIIRQYVGACYVADQYAELDQAGETDPERSTLLHKVFIDLNVQVRKGTQPWEFTSAYRDLADVRVDESSDRHPEATEDGISAMQILVKEVWPRMVFIGGPGQGKSTLGQHIAQIHRASLLGHTHEYTLRRPRIPFRVVLKYFAQWLVDEPPSAQLEHYLAHSIKKVTVNHVSAEEVQTVFRRTSCLLILDGLDEVVSSETRARVLTRIQSFLSRMNSLNADVFAIATSRPTGYKDNFDPNEFWHLELLPLSQKRVTEFATKWVTAKQRREEESSRILRTLKDCQGDPSISKLLTTPLQVTIILLIIKDGGRPPAQREALFNDYWSTIFRREKSKDKGIIQSDEPILFNLHSYLGYVLHVRAEGEDVQSLLPEIEFKKTVREFLRRNDKHSPEEAIASKLDQLVAEARDRLVMIVEPEPGLFGFELRSIQEFFAAVHLVQTASNTAKRFERLRAIARPAHWRNVALLSSGRISRNNSGEASNILELVCRPIDREGIDRYLRRGEWLALEIAGDGALGTNRDLQYSALELGLNILRFGLASDQRRSLSALLMKLSPEDRQDILSPLLNEHIQSLPTARLGSALAIYGQHFGALDPFKQKVDFLIGTYGSVALAWTDVIATKPDVQWLAGHLRSLWPAWKDDLVTWYGAAPQYVDELLKAIDLTVEEIFELIEIVWDTHWSTHRTYYDSVTYTNVLTRLNLEDVHHPVGQLLIALRCASLANRFSNHIVSVSHENMGEVTFNFNGLDRLNNLVEDTETADIGAKLDIVLNRPDLNFWLKAQLWKVYWNIAKPTLQNVTKFLDDFRKIRLSKPTLDKETLSWAYNSPWPLHRLALQKELTDGLGASNSLIPYLEARAQLGITEEILRALRVDLIDASEQTIAALFRALDYEFGLSSVLPSLIPIANRLQVTVEQLMGIYIVQRVYKEQRKPSSEEFSQILDLVEQKLNLSSEISDWIFHFLDLPTEFVAAHPESLKRLLRKVLSLSPSPQEYLRTDLIVYLFTRLLAVDEEVRTLADDVFYQLGTSRYFDEEAIDSEFQEVSAERLWNLNKQLSSNDENIRRGAAMFWTHMATLETIDDETGEPIVEDRFANYELRPDLLFDLMNETDEHLKKAGLLLFAFSRFPITEYQRREELRANLEWSRTYLDAGIWTQFLQTARVSEEDKGAWVSFLKQILDEPNKYGNEILDAAKWRYCQLADYEPPPFLDTEEPELRLP